MLAQGDIGNNIIARVKTSAVNYGDLIKGTGVGEIDTSLPLPAIEGQITAALNLLLAASGRHAEVNVVQADPNPLVFNVVIGEGELNPPW